jgi:hypothetical protein
MPDLIPAKGGILDRHPETDGFKYNWIPAFAGMTGGGQLTVVEIA